MLNSRLLRGTALGAVLLSACSLPGRPTSDVGSARAAGQAPEGLILQAGEGERRVRRPRPGSSTAQSTPFILKVDALNGASPDLVMGYEEIAPGEAIQPHRHLVADEILFVHRGSGIATLGGRDSPVRTGATVYIPRNLPVSVRNTGAEPLAVAFFFSKPGFEQLMRANSALEGAPITSLSTEEQAAIRTRHRWHTIAGEPEPGASRAAGGGLVLQAGQGERRVARPGAGAETTRLPTPFILKVDRRTGGSSDLVMGYGEIAPGDLIGFHRHVHADEIIFVHRGSGRVGLGTREAEVGTGATIYVPRGNPVRLRNTALEPLGIVFVFSRPGFEELMREISVPEGEVARPLSAEEQAAIHARHRWHTIYP